jgi:hypothetical protein
MSHELFNRELYAYRLFITIIGFSYTLYYDYCIIYPRFVCYSIIIIVMCHFYFDEISYYVIFLTVTQYYLYTTSFQTEFL